MTVVYLIFGKTGEYEDYNKIILFATNDISVAETRVEALNNWAKENNVYEHMDNFEINECPLYPEGMSFYCSDHGIQYSYQTVQYLDNVPKRCVEVLNVERMGF